jgi:hypothetical protein
MLFVFSLTAFCTYCFNDNMPWGGSILVKSVWCPEGFLYLNGQNFLKIWEIFCNYFIEHFAYSLGLDLFSFFNAHDSQVRSFDGVAKLLNITLTALELFE